MSFKWNRFLETPRPLETTATKPRATRHPRGGTKSANNQSSHATRQSQSTAEAAGTSAPIGNYFATDNVHDEIADCINCKKNLHLRHRSNDKLLLMR